MIYDAIACLIFALVLFNFVHVPKHRQSHQPYVLHGLRADLYQVQNTQITKIGWHFVDTRGYPTWQASPVSLPPRTLCACAPFCMRGSTRETLAAMCIGHAQMLNF